MNKTKVKPSTQEGWAVHVYDSDRHLRFTLEPSHIWAFSWGIGTGVLIAMLWSALSQVVPGPSVNSADPTNPLPTGAAIHGEGYIKEGDRPESFGLPLFGID